MLRALSVAAFAAMAGLVGLFYSGALSASRPLVLAIQVAAFVLMVAARITHEVESEARRWSGRLGRRRLRLHRDV